MIKSITVTNPSGEELKLTLANPELSEGMAVGPVTGLGPVKSTVNTTTIASMDGVLFNSARVGARNIVLPLVFVGGDIETIRQKTYKYFPVKKQVKLVIETDNRIVETYGHVEANETNIFSKEASTQVSIICDSAFLASSGPNGIVATQFYSTTPMFQFPFANESLVTKLLNFGHIDLDTTKAVVYDGDLEVGMTVYIQFSGAVTGLKIHNLTTGEFLSINSTIVNTLTGSPFKTGDSIIITTSKGNKSITLYRNSVAYNIMNALGLSPKWLTLVKGLNEIAVAADVGVDKIQVLVENRVLYEGI